MSMITSELKSKFDVLVSYYPADQKQAAVIPLLHLMQDAATGNYLTEASQQAVADYLEMPISKVHEVVSFYTMLSEKPRGKNHLLVCHTLPCDLTGCASVVKAIAEKLHIHDGEVTPDGKFSMEEAECLARCGEGPVMQVGDTVYTHLSLEKTGQIIDELAKRG
jgi:NADH-quinone oxidoreductase subunit E